MGPGDWRRTGHYNLHHTEEVLPVSGYVDRRVANFSTRGDGCQRLLTGSVFRFCQP